MDFTRSDDERELAGLARKILTDRLTPERLRAVEAGDIAESDQISLRNH